MPIPKFNFVPERQLTAEYSSYTPGHATLRYSSSTDKQTGYVINQSTLAFSTETIQLYDLTGRLIRIYADKERRAIGWTFLDDSMPLSDLEDTRSLKINPSNGQITLSVGKLLKSMGIRLSQSYKKLEIKKHLDSLTGREIFYIEIPNPEVK